MRAALPDDDLFDRGTTNRAGLTAAAVCPEMVLKIAAAVDPVDAGAVAANAFLQYAANSQP